MFDRTQFDSGASGVITTATDWMKGCNARLGPVFGDFSAHQRATTRSADDSALETATP